MRCIGFSVLRLSFYNPLLPRTVFLGSLGNERLNFLDFVHFFSSYSLLSYQNCPHRDICVGVYACLGTNHRCAYSLIHTQFCCCFGLWSCEKQNFQMLWDYMLCVQSILDYRIVFHSIIQHGEIQFIAPQLVLPG